jgi:putative membrane protein
MDEQSARPLALGVRSALGGVLMGLANLVPGVSGGTMLLAAGVYPSFIAAIAELTTFRVRGRSLLLVGAIAGSAALTVLLLAGSVRAVVIDHRWVTYSLFIGLTLGGLPLVWRLARPASPAVLAGAAGGLALMLVMALGQAGADGRGSSVWLLLVSGLVGASAMILPGISGGYLLLLLGQYERILGAIDQLRAGLAAQDPALLVQAATVVAPVGVGVLVGIVGVSNLLKWLLDRFEKATLGALLGLLLGAVIGLWPFQQGVAPEPGDLLRGRALTQADIEALDREDWPLRVFRPRLDQALGALGLIAIGLAATQAIDWLGRGLESRGAKDRPPGPRTG